MGLLRQLAVKVRGEEALGVVSPEDILKEYAKAGKDYEVQNKVAKEVK